MKSAKKRNKVYRPQTQRGLSQEHLTQLACTFRLAMDSHDYQVAGDAAAAALKFQPGNVSVMADYALCLMRQQHYRQAHVIYMQIYNLPLEQQAQSLTWLDGLTEVCGWLGLFDDVKRYGGQSLEHSAAAQGQQQAALITAAPAAFRSEYPERNIIAYSLFGDNPRYCEPAVTNVRTALELFPHWRCRVYLDDSVPADVQRRLRDAGAQVVDMTGAQDGVHPLMWRFLVVDDPEVERFLIRDADSLLCERERAAVEQWLQSPCWFHHMRDYFTHTALVLAGLWGGCRGALPPLKPLMQQWLSQRASVTRFSDQHFLMEVVWPTLRQSVLNHDELFAFHGAQPFPLHRTVRWGTKDVAHHIGSNASPQEVVVICDKADGERQSWQIVDEQGGVVCSYRSLVFNGRWKTSLPHFFISHIQATRWRIVQTELRDISHRGQPVI